MGHFVGIKFGEKVSSLLDLRHRFHLFVIRLRAVLDVPGHGDQLFRIQAFRKTEYACFRRADRDKAIVGEYAAFHVVNRIKTCAI